MEWSRKTSLKMETFELEAEQQRRTGHEKSQLNLFVFCYPNHSSGLNSFLSCRTYSLECACPTILQAGVTSSISQTTPLTQNPLL